MKRPRVPKAERRGAQSDPTPKRTWTAPASTRHAASHRRGRGYSR